jgi:hypothetical protein
MKQQPVPQPGSSPSTLRQTTERRAWIRFHPRCPQIYWQPFGSKDQEMGIAEVLNVSSRGIGLVLDRSVATGSILVLKFSRTDPKARQHFVRVKEVADFDGKEFKVGATFVVPLAEEHLQTLLG